MEYSGEILSKDSLAIPVSHQILKIPTADLSKKFNLYGRTSIYCDTKKTLSEKKNDLHRNNPAWPKILSIHEGNFTAKH